MANRQFTIPSGDRTDDTAFTVPGNEDGGENEPSFQVEPDNLDKAREWYVHITNGFDQDINATVQGSHHLDEDMNNAVDDGNTETITSGTSGVFDGMSNHSYIQLNVNPAATPTGDDLVVTFQSREA